MLLLLGPQPRTRWRPQATTTRPASQPGVLTRSCSADRTTICCSRTTSRGAVPTRTWSRVRRSWRMGRIGRSAWSGPTRRTDQTATCARAPRPGWPRAACTPR
uniref:(northern house mosquito) hypothetical protein n=1 Tax=Culex pipiens TaxID=7175 RepID=A0A8D8MJJ1_CULPI